MFRMSRINEDSPIGLLIIHNTGIILSHILLHIKIPLSLCSFFPFFLCLFIPFSSRLHTSPSSPESPHARRACECRPSPDFRNEENCSIVPSSRALVQQAYH